MWEIDVFSNLNLVMAELEFLTKYRKLADEFIKSDKKLPLFIKSNLIKEVTGMPEFLNINLAKPYVYKNINFVHKQLEIFNH